MATSINYKVKFLELLQIADDAAKKNISMSELEREVARLKEEAGFKEPKG